MNQTELIELGKTTLAEQETQIDNLMDTVTNIGTISKTIGSELETDIQLLGRINRGIDQNTGVMTKTQQKLGGFLKSTSNCCLLMTVAVELLVFILLLTL